MRVPRLRFSIRGMMIAILALGLLIQAVRLGRVSLRHREKARQLAAKEAALTTRLLNKEALIAKVAAHIATASSRQPQGIKEHEEKKLLSLADGELRVEAEATKHELDSVAIRHRKYRRAAWRPWERVAPDLPQP